MEENASQGICLPGCTALHTFCENIPDPFVAGCAEYFNPDVGEVNVCVLFCRYKSSQFPCPNDTDYTCKSYSKDIGVCIAK